MTSWESSRGVKGTGNTSLKLRTVDWPGDTLGSYWHSYAGVDGIIGPSSSASHGSIIHPHPCHSPQWVKHASWPPDLGVGPKPTTGKWQILVQWKLEVFVCSFYHWLELWLLPWLSTQSRGTRAVQGPVGRKTGGKHDCGLWRPSKDIFQTGNLHTAGC